MKAFWIGVSGKVKLFFSLTRTLLELPPHRLPEEGAEFPVQPGGIPRGAVTGKFGLIYQQPNMNERKKFEIFCTCSSCGRTSLAHGVLQLLPSAAEARRWWEENRERMHSGNKCKSVFFIKKAWDKKGLQFFLPAYSLFPHPLRQP